MISPLRVQSYVVHNSTETQNNDPKPPKKENWPRQNDEGMQDVCLKANQPLS